MLKVFFSYSHKDADLLDELNRHLATLRNLNLIEQWTDKEILPGDAWEPEIWRNFETADIVILLISADFLASRYCYRKEFEAAEQRHLDKTARVIPIIVRDCDWKDGRLDRLQCLCADKPVALYGDDRVDRDPAWALVARKLRDVVTQMAAPKPQPRTDPAPPADIDRLINQIGADLRELTRLARRCIAESRWPDAQQVLKRLEREALRVSERDYAAALELAAEAFWKAGDAAAADRKWAVAATVYARLDPADASRFEQRKAAARA